MLNDQLLIIRLIVVNWSLRMSFSSVNRSDTSYSVPTLTRVHQDIGEVAVAASKRKDSESIETSILLTEEASRATGLRAGMRVSLLRGTGVDKGKVRIVANPLGSLKLGETFEPSPYHVRLRTSRLLSRTRSAKTAKVLSYAKGALTLSIS